MTYKLLLISVFIFSGIFPMDTRVVDTCVVEVDLEKAEVFTNGEGLALLQKYYDPESKTLNLQNLDLTDDLLRSRYKTIKKFINMTQAENLILERNSLTTIPYYLITFALINKHIRYLSLKHNRFNIPLMIAKEDMHPGIVIPLEAMRCVEFKTISSEIEQALKRNRSGSIGKDDLISMMAHNLWKNISPEIEQAISKHNLKKRDRFMYKKIIVIDSNIPPITIIDYQDMPRSKREKVKAVCYKISYVLLGAAITLLPQITTWIVEAASGKVTENSDSI